MRRWPLAKIDYFRLPVINSNVRVEMYTRRREITSDIVCVYVRVFC